MAVSRDKGQHVKKYLSSKVVNPKWEAIHGRVSTKSKKWVGVVQDDPIDRSGAQVDYAQLEEDY